MDFARTNAGVTACACSMHPAPGVVPPVTSPRAAPLWELRSERARNVRIWVMQQRCGRPLMADSVEKLDSKIWPTKHRPRERGCGAVLIANYVELNSRGPTFAENWCFFATTRAA